MKICEYFDKEVLEAEGVVLVDFFAEWCGPCRALIPLLEELSSEITNVTFLKFNVDSDDTVPLKYNITSIPYLILFKNGQVLSTKIGGASKAEVKSWIDDIVAKNNKF